MTDRLSASDARRRALLVLPIAVALLGLAACTGAPASAEPSASCLESMSALEAAPADAENDVIDPMVEATLNECETADAWLAALRQHPGAQLLENASDVTRNLFDINCSGFPETVACEAAAK